MKNFEQNTIYRSKYGISSEKSVTDKYKKWRLNETAGNAKKSIIQDDNIESRQ